MNDTPFKLSDLSASAAQDPAMMEYLRCYEFPQGNTVRYGYMRFASEQRKERISLFGQAWVPSHALGTVLLLPGYAEHAGNYAQLVQDLVQARFAVMVLDYRGHGLSEGPRGHLEHPEYYAQDVEDFMKRIFPQLLPSLPLYLWGHSLGGLIALQLLQRDKLAVRPAASVLSSPFLGLPPLAGSQKILAALAPLIGLVLPTLPVPHGIPPGILSHDEVYLKRRGADPLIGHHTTPCWLASVKAAIEGVQSHAKEYLGSSPTLLMLAGDEKVTNLNDARRFAFQAYGSLNHKVIEFPGYYHELEKEPGIRARVIAESLAWLKSHN